MKLGDLKKMLPDNEEAVIDLIIEGNLKFLYEIVELAKGISDNGKIKLLNSEKFCARWNNSYLFSDIINILENKNRYEVLNNMSLVRE